VIDHSPAQEKQSNRNPLGPRRGLVTEPNHSREDSSDGLLEAIEAAIPPPLQKDSSVARARQLSPEPARRAFDVFTSQITAIHGDLRDTKSRKALKRI
jgi:hypothetical protein